MDKEIKNTIINSVFIVKSCPVLLLVFFLLCFLGYSTVIFSIDKKWPFLILTILFWIFLKPAAYGGYIEIINGNEHISYFDIFKLHGLNFYIVCILITLSTAPVLLIMNFFIMDKNAFESEKIFEIILNILSIYIIPLVFLLKERIRPISLGLKCIIGNLGDSLYLILLILSVYFVKLLFTNYGGIFFENNMLIYLFISTGIEFISLLIDFIVFVAASLILKEKLFNV